MKFISQQDIVKLSETIIARSTGRDFFVVGINGAQGSGKTTTSQILQDILQTKYHKQVVLLSLDDLYKTKAERQQMANTIHPLFITRGVPGTHDVKLGLKLLAQLRSSTANSEIAIPVFAKAKDDRLPQKYWRKVTGKVDIVLFEGWCVGAQPQLATELIEPVNELEAQEDSAGIWRTYVNNTLATEYQQLFAKLDILVMLKVVSCFAEVYQYRLLQEQESKAMNATEVKRFILHYQRITEAMLKNMPKQADLVLQGK